MKNIPIQLMTALGKPGRSTCFCAKVVSRDGTVVRGFTNLDDVVRFNDGIHYVEYDPTQPLVPQNIQNTSDLDPDNTELHGWFDEEVKAALMSGVLQSGEITIYRVAYLNLSAGAEVVAYGTIGKVEYSADASGSRKIEFRGLDELIENASCELTSVTCRNDFGDEICRMPFVWEAGTVDEVADPLFQFKVTGITEPDNWFNLGVVLFDNGENATVTAEIETWTADGWITLSFAPPNNILPGTAVKLRRDCDKTFTTCKNYNNVRNMNAEHLMPVSDTSLMVPGAYIKSNNAL